MSGKTQLKDYNTGGSLLFPLRGVHLHSMVKGAGRQLTSDHSYSWDGTMRGNRDMVLWQYTISGCGAVDYASRTMYLEPGKAFVLIVPEKHRYYLPENSDHWEFLYISLNGSELVRLAMEIRRLSGAVSNRYGTPRVLEVANRIIDGVNSGAFSPHEASAIGYEFIMALLNESEASPAEMDVDLHQIMHDYCLQNIERHPDIDELAAVAGYSRGHFYRKFKEKTGHNPHEFILDLKMRFAMRKLQTQYNISVKEVAAACGFDDPSYFCKVFKKIFGVTPACFRGEKHKKEITQYDCK